MTKPVFATDDVPDADEVNEFFVNINFIRKAIQTDRATTTTLADDPELTIPVVANAIYVAEIVLFYQSQAAVDFKFQPVAPSGSSYRYTLNGLHSSTASVYSDDQSAALDLSNVANVSGIGAVLAGVQCRGLLRTGGTAGAFKVQWAQLTSGATTSLMIDSYISLDRKS
ncbi:hypothetical protein [Actinoplanes regularis]|uniref:hypothetical protein n=1 Tax=Actinoplanes regularis TaxID=52697 RepID=UPI0024A14216|nr:hypothetical protein [Actinoplanes regularis]GLW32280.1 hypothetical protein Areg01_52190 [Actinoplanes regularis]